jgi:hypothetical protein
MGMRKLLLAGAMAATALGPLANVTAAFADDTPQANCQSGLATANVNASGNQSGQSLPGSRAGQSATCDQAPVTPGQP